MQRLHRPLAHYINGHPLFRGNETKFQIRGSTFCWHHIPYHFEHFDIRINIIQHGQQPIQRRWIKRWHNDMPVLTFALDFMNVQLCKLWMLSFGRTQGSDFVIKLTLNAKGIRSSASCYQLINFGTERTECQHQIVHANLISKFDDTFYFVG
jgi:hypothetical protein